MSSTAPAATALVRTLLSCPTRDIDEVEWPGGCRYRITETSASLNAMSRRSTTVFTPSD
jgi:hypothetical protein